MLLLCYVSTILTIAVYTTHAADEAIMTIRVESSTTALYTLTFSTKLFWIFSTCVCGGWQTSCIMKYDTSRQPDSQFLDVISSGKWSDVASACKYYKCRVNQSQGEVICEQQNPANYLCSKDSLHQSVNISNLFFCKENCVTFVWTLNTEGLTSPYWSIQKCDNNCLCPATAAAETMANTNLISRMTSHETTVTIEDQTSTQKNYVKISSSSLVSTTITVNNSEDENNYSSAAIIGSVLSVIVIVVIVIVALIVWRSRTQMCKPPKPLKHYVNVRDSNGKPASSESGIKNQQNMRRNGPAAENAMNQNTEEFDKNNYLNCHIISPDARQRERISFDKEKAGFSGTETAFLLTKTSPTSETSEYCNAKKPEVEYKNYNSTGFHGYSNTIVTASEDLTDTVAGAWSVSANTFSHNSDNSHNSYDHIIEYSNNLYNHITDASQDSHYYDKLTISKAGSNATIKQNAKSEKQVYEARSSDNETNVSEYEGPLKKSNGSEFTYYNS